MLQAVVTGMTDTHDVVLLSSAAYHGTSTWPSSKLSVVAVREAAAAVSAYLSRAEAIRFENRLQLIKHWHALLAP